VVVAAVRAALEAAPGVAVAAAQAVEAAVVVAAGAGAPVGGRRRRRRGAIPGERSWGVRAQCR
jgi:hypothetical protein